MFQLVDINDNFHHDKELLRNIFNLQPTNWNHIEMSMNVCLEILWWGYLVDLMVVWTLANKNSDILKHKQTNKSGIHFWEIRKKGVLVQRKEAMYLRDLSQRRCLLVAVGPPANNQSFQLSITNNQSSQAFMFSIKHQNQSTSNQTAMTCRGLTISPVSVRERLLTPLLGAALASSSPSTAFRSTWSWSVTMLFGLRFSLFDESTMSASFSAIRSWQSAVRVVVEPQLLPDKLGREVEEVRAEPGDPPSNITWVTGAI